MPHWHVWQWAAAALAAFSVGVAKTGVPGVGILAVPVFALLLPARESVGTVLIILLCADILAVATYRRDADWKQLLRLLPWSLAGVALGAWAMGHLDDIQIKRLIGGILLPLVGLALWRRQRAAKGAPEWELPLWAGVLAGVLAGFTTMVANAAGPIMVLYLLAMRLPKIAFLGTAAWYFFLVNWIKVPFGIAQGMIHAASLLTAASLFPAAIAGGLCGRALAQRIDQRLFEALALAFTAIAAVRLILS